MITIKKRHHFLPEFYLRGFADPDSSSLWMYQKNCETVKRISPHNAAVITFYYSFKTEIGKLDHDTIENMMADVEGESAPIFRKIENNEKLNEEERRTFSLFLSLIRIRVPNFRNNIENSGAEVIKITMKEMASNKERFHSILEKYKRDTGQEITIPADELREFALDDSRYRVTVDPIFSLSIGLNMAIKMSDIICGMKWDFLLTTGEHDFLTSDF